MEKENWIKWLQARIPELKESHNEFWVSQALDGYLESKQNQALSMSGVVVSPCDHSDTYPLNQKYSMCRKCGGCVED